MGLLLRGMPNNVGQTSSGLTNSAVGSGAMWHEQQSRSRASMTQTSETACSCRHMDSHLTGRAVLSLSGRLRLTFLHTYLYECLENRLNVSRTLKHVVPFTQELQRFYCVSRFIVDFGPPKEIKHRRKTG